jgi:hypothetical protein
MVRDTRGATMNQGDVAAEMTGAWTLCYHLRLRLNRVV